MTFWQYYKSALADCRDLIATQNLAEFLAMATVVGGFSLVIIAITMAISRITGAGF